jgi:hypothetical protein
MPAPGAAGRLMFTTSSGPTATLTIAPDFVAPGNYPGVGACITGLVGETLLATLAMPSGVICQRPAGLTAG